MALALEPFPAVNVAHYVAEGDSASNTGGASARSFEGFSQSVSSVTRDEVGTTPKVLLAPPPPNAVVEEVEDEDDAEPEVENKFKGICLATPHLPSEHEAIFIPNGAGAAIVLREDDLWDNGDTITYAFMPRTSKHLECSEKKVHDIVKEWSLYANISFKHIPNAKEALVRIAFDSPGSWSLTGKKEIKERPTDQSTMNLGGVLSICKTQEEDVGTILHEFGHVLGLKHELLSPSRNDVFKMNEQLTVEAFNNLSPTEVHKEILDVYKSNDVYNYTALDPTSIMMYPMAAALNDKGIETKFNNKLSDYDKAFMLIHYPYFGVEPQVEGWDFAKALDVFDIQGEAREEMMELYSAGNVSDLRQRYGQVHDSVRNQLNAALARDAAAGRPAQA